ncbi:MAG TPA: type II secretion system protein GspG [Pyrinomonadaceae bacterium]|nr:type II secretion system protein GspG [Pyrinomonadaceae bacterium]
MTRRGTEKRRAGKRNGRALTLLAALCVAFAFQSPAAFVAQKEKLLKAKDAQRLIVAVPGTSLNRSAVVVREVSTSGAEAVASVSVRTAFRLREVEEQGAGGKVRRLRVEQIRVGDRLWEDADLLLRALGAGADALADVESLAAELIERQARAQREAKEAEERERAAGAAEKEKDEKKTRPTPTPTPDEPSRGAFKAKGLTSMFSGTAVEAEVEMGFRFVREGNKWRVDALRLGGGEWLGLAGLASSLDALKSTRARAELASVAVALEAFRRERGFYVVSDSHVVLVDHLNPRYLPEVVRVDPWHRPYRYAGTRDSYRLTSDGPDGREGTPDDINVSKS